MNNSKLYNNKLIEKHNNDKKNVVTQPKNLSHNFDNPPNPFNYSDDEVMTFREGNFNRNNKINCTEIKAGNLHKRNPTVAVNPLEI